MAKDYIFHKNQVQGKLLETWLKRNRAELGETRIVWESLAEELRQARANSNAGDLEEVENYYDSVRHLFREAWSMEFDGQAAQELNAILLYERAGRNGARISPRGVR
jgi:hypothetical protein